MGHHGPRAARNAERMERAAQGPRFLKDKDPFLRHKELERYVSKDGTYAMRPAAKVDGVEYLHLVERATGETVLIYRYDAAKRTLLGIDEKKTEVLSDPSLTAARQDILAYLDPGPEQGQIEFASSDGKYLLVKHMTAAQLHAIGRFLENCLQYHRQKHREFLEKIQKGESEVFTLEEKIEDAENQRTEHRPVLAIEYDVVNQKIEQVFGRDNSHPVLLGDYLGALFESADYLSHGTAYDIEGRPYERGAKPLAGLDLTGFEMIIRGMKPYGGLIDRRGYHDAKDALELGIKEAYTGFIVVRPPMPEQELRQYANIRGVTLDMTEADDAQRAALTHVQSTLMDKSFDGRVTYPNLLHAETILMPDTILHAEFPLLVDARRIVTSAQKLSVPSLQKAKSIRVDKGAEIVAPREILSSGVVHED